ncbi:MAG: rRNA maturation RNase YbeY [Candidatus Symbiothrix sp.]|jgi:rRNA maturation RNase YbeY|nr:rRNA maturation RNase YbeY [Candidatus Symbiothrix sp.]
MAIIYNAVEVKIPKFKHKEMNLWIQEVAKSYQKKIGEISYIFCSDKEILRMNKVYLAHDYYTDIITFDYSKEDIISADMFISLETVCSNAKKYCTEEDEELRRVMIHGILHLCGFKDKKPEDAVIMRANENAALKLSIK